MSGSLRHPVRSYGTTRSKGFDTGPRARYGDGLIREGGVMRGRIQLLYLMKSLEASQPAPAYAHRCAPSSRGRSEVLSYAPTGLHAAHAFATHGLRRLTPAYAVGYSVAPLRGSGSVTGGRWSNQKRLQPGRSGTIAA
jgi:hypothetical protein